MTAQQDHPGAAFGLPNTHTVRGHGIYQPVTGTALHRPHPEPLPGEHLWIFTAAWRVTDPTNPHQTFDTENLLSVEGPGCLWCEALHAQIVRPDGTVPPCPGEHP